MKDGDVFITSQVDEAQYRQAIEIFYDSFEEKIRPLLRPREKALAVHYEAINRQMAYYALKDGRTVGLAGLQYEGMEFVTYRMDILRSQYSFFRSIYLYLLLNMFRTRIEEGVMRIDSIAVLPSSRGLGIGTRLIKKVIETAKKRGLTEVVLEVVDTNPEAKRLYKNLGFLVKRRINFYFFTRPFGFRSIYVMSKHL
jgi:ribosomal protein S18 acetylase RimI-like enzyme